MNTLLDELREKYRADRTALLQEELDLLCAFDNEIRAEQSRIWQQRLGCLECEYKGAEITVTPEFETDAGRIVEQLEGEGFHNTRTYYDHSSTFQIRGNRNTWLDTISKKGETLYQQIHQHTGIKPLYVSWFAGEIVVDLRTGTDVQAVESYLRAQVMLNHQHLLLDKDPLLSLDITRIKIMDSLTDRTLEA